MIRYVPNGSNVTKLTIICHSNRLSTIIKFPINWYTVGIISNLSNISFCVSFIPQVLYQNLVYEECFRFLNPLIVKRRQNIRQTALRAWKRKITTERHLVHYVERRNKDQIWKNDYSVKPKLAGGSQICWLVSNLQREGGAFQSEWNMILFFPSTRYFLEGVRELGWALVGSRGL